MTQHIDKSTGHKVDKILTTHKTSHVNPVPGSQELLRARYAAGVTTPVHVSWPAGANITELVIYASPTVETAAGQTGQYAIIAIDAASEALGTSFVTQVDSKLDDVQWIPVPVGELVRIPLTEALSQGPNSAGRVTVASRDLSIDVWIGAS